MFLKWFILFFTKAFIAGIFSIQISRLLEKSQRAYVWGPFSHQTAPTAGPSTALYLCTTALQLKICFRKEKILTKPHPPQVPQSHSTSVPLHCNSVLKLKMSLRTKLVLTKLHQPQVSQRHSTCVPLHCNLVLKLKISFRTKLLSTNCSQRRSFVVHWHV